MGFTSVFKGLINVLCVNKQEFCASSWSSTKVSDNVSVTHLVADRSERHR